MISKNKRHKEVQFHKVKTQNFGKAKKFIINKSLNEIKVNHIFIYFNEKYTYFNILIIIMKLINLKTAIL